MPTTSNFGWTTPADTDLVKDGASAIRTLGNNIDASMADLKGGTTGQVLSKNSNTDLDFTWVAQDDSNAIQNALLTTTGDTIYASAASTPARLGIGTNGQVLTVSAGLPTWQNSSSGGMTLLSTTTLTGASVTVSSIDQSYVNLYILITDVDYSGDDYMIIRPNTATSNLRNATYSTISGTMNVATSAWQTTQQRNVDQLNNEHTIAMVINNYSSTNSFKLATWNSSFTDASTGANAGAWGFGQYSSVSAISSIQFRCDGAFNFDAGTIKIYGVK